MTFGLLPSLRSSSLLLLPCPSLSILAPLRSSSLVFPLTTHSFSVSLVHRRPHESLLKSSSSVPRVSIGKAERSADDDQERDERQILIEEIGYDGEVYRKTLRLVECAMLASLSGLTYFLSNTLAVENYFGCFFSLPIVISSLRWGLEAGRKTMVATVFLLFTISGPVKASTYLLMHGLVGLAMGSLWRLGVNWGISITLCTLVRAVGAVGYVLVSSFLIRENILNLITINIHASLAYICMAIGVNTIPSMNAIYAIFGFLLFLNCGFFVFLLHIMYAVFLSKLGMRSSLKLPSWLNKAAIL